MNQEILTIEKGWGEGSIYYHCNSKWDTSSSRYVEKITQERKDIGPGLIVVYRGYKNTKHTEGTLAKKLNISKWILVFEIEAGSGITLTFKEEQK